MHICGFLRTFAADFNFVIMSQRFMSICALCAFLCLCGCEKQKPDVFGKRYSSNPIVALDIEGEEYTTIYTYAFDDVSVTGKVGYVSFWEAQGMSFMCRDPWPYKQNGTSITIDCGDSIQHLRYYGDSIVHCGRAYYYAGITN